jgi:RHS repeat-associated protein
VRGNIFKKQNLLQLFIYIFSAIVVVSTGIAIAGFSGWISENQVKLSTYGINVFNNNSDANLTDEVKSASNVLDNDTTTSYAPSESRTIQFSLANETTVSVLKVYGVPSYNITLYALKSAGQWVNIGKAGNGKNSAWNTYIIGSNVKSSQYRLKLDPQGIPGAAINGVNEIELWGNGESANIKDGASLSGLLDASDPVSFAGKYPATPAQASVTITRNNDNATYNNAVFTATIPEGSASFRRAWLVYDLNGFAGWISIEHTINGKGWKMAWPMPGQDGWTQQVEPIDPDLLQSGDNVITFMVPTGAAAGYSIRNLRVITEKDNGYNNIKEALGANLTAPNMLDGDPVSSWIPASPGDNVVFNTYKPVQADSLAVMVSGNMGGTMVLSGFVDGDWKPVTDIMDGKSLKNGWNNITIKTASPINKFRLDFTGTAGSGAVSEAAICGSGIGPLRTAGLEISYPDNGQYYGRAAYVSGFIPVIDNGSGQAQVLIGPNTAVIKDGVFSGVVSKEDVGMDAQNDSDPWSVDITLLYPDGTKYTKTIVLNSMIGYDPTKVAASGDTTYGFGLKGAGSRKIKVGDVELEMQRDDEDKSSDIQIVPLSDRDLPSLDTGMVNVTGVKYRGYRFLPHHSKFKKKMRIKIPYDKARIPAGKKEKDVRTYYFNDRINRWMPVELDQVDNTNQAVFSMTDHFTDFINATIVVPDHQQEQNFNPNQIKDLKAALPNAGITFVEPPSGNNKGDAALSYKIEVPPGRQGMQPDVTIAYNSGGGDGLLGAGWDMPLKCVMVDTKFGAPRYNLADFQGKESESYLLEGEQLLPNARAMDTTDFDPRNNDSTDLAGKRFFSRVEGKFLRILRKIKDTGRSPFNTPDNYYWEVTDKNGTLYRYGIENTSILPDSGGTYIWALTKTIDKNGNCIDYHYRYNDNDTDHTDLLLDYISYGIYQVKFIYEDRLFPRVDCRGGFEKNVKERLKKVHVFSHSNLVRTYRFGYETDPNKLKFGKDRLVSIQQFANDGSPDDTDDYDGTPITTEGHTFEYYDEVQKGDYGASGSQKYNFFDSDRTFTWKTNVDEAMTDLLNSMSVAGVPLGPTGISGFLSNEHGDSWSAKAAFKLELFLIKIEISIDVKYGFSLDTGHTTLSLMDIDGDGLPDIVYGREGLNGFNYLRNTSLGFESQLRNLNKLPDLSSESTETNYFGVNAGVDVPGLVGFSGGVSPINITVKQDKYMSDVNGDGIPDLCNNGTVYFGKLDKTSGIITYDKSTANLAAPIGPSCGVDLSTLEDMANQIFLDSIKASPLVATIKKWEAPYTGNIRIDGNVALIQDTSDARASYKTADGVRVTIQQSSDQVIDTVNNKNYKILWRRDINTIPQDGVDPADFLPDYGQHDPHDSTQPYADSKYFPLDGTIFVHAGDRLYFRVQSIYDGAYDRVSWNPQVTYVDKVATPTWTDSNYLSQAVYGNTADFTDFSLAGRRAVTYSFPYNGTIRLAGDLHKAGKTTDDIKLRIKLIYGATGTTADYNNADTHPDQVLGWAQENASIPMGTDGTEFSAQYREITVTAGDQLVLYADVDSNVDAQQITWKPYSYYIDVQPASVKVLIDNTKGGNDPKKYTTYTPMVYDAQFYPKNIGGIENREYDVKIPVLETAAPPAPASDQTVALRVRGQVSKSAKTTQDVRISVLLNSQVNPDGTVVDGTGTTVDVALIDKDVTGSCFSLPDNLVYLPKTDSRVWPVTSIRLVMTTGNKTDMQSFTWSPELTYVLLDPVGNIVQETRAAETPMPYEANLTTENDTDASTVDVKWIRNMYARPRFQRLAPLGDLDSRNVRSFGSIDYIFTVKKYGALQSKSKITMSDAYNDYQPDVPVGDVLPGDKLFFECFTKVTGGFTCPDKVTLAQRLMYNNITSIYPDITDNTRVHIPGVREIYFPVNPRFEDEDADLFASPYRGWAYAGLKEIPDVLQPDYVFTAPLNDMKTLLGRPDCLSFFKSPTPDSAHFFIDESKLTYKYLLDPHYYDSVPTDPDDSTKKSVTMADLAQMTFLPYQYISDTTSLPVAEWRTHPDVYGRSNEMGTSRTNQKYIRKLTLEEILGSSNLGDVTSVNRLTTSSQFAGNMGVSVPVAGTSLSMSGSYSQGDSVALTDFMDMNGDGYPDKMLGGQITYTNPNGGLGCTKYSFSDIRKTHAQSMGGSVGSMFNPAYTKPDPKAGSLANPKNPPAENTASTSFSPQVGLSVNASGSTSFTTTQFTLLDMNGDGLPDKVSYNDNTHKLDVYYNTGYGFSDTKHEWDTDAISSGLSVSSSLGGGISVGGEVGGWGGGVQAGTTGSVGLSKSLKSLTDVNGDGLPDIIFVDGSVSINTGSGFEPPVNVGLDASYGVGLSINTGWTAGGYVTVPILGLFSLTMGYDTSGSNAMSKQKDILIDIDGDGSPDKVYTDILDTDLTSLMVNKSDEIKGYFNHTGRTNLLKKVNMPLGATIEIEYQPSKHTQDMPKPRWDMTRVTVKDGFTADQSITDSDTQIVDYSYDDALTGGTNSGKYDRAERDFLGHAYVFEKHYLDNTDASKIRIVKRHYDVSSFYRKGLLLSESIYGSDSDVTNNTPHYEKIYTYTPYDPADSSTMPGEPIYADAHGEYSFYPQLLTTVENTYDTADPLAPGPGPVRKTESFDYDGLGNIISYGTVGSEGDVLQAVVTYKFNEDDSLDFTLDSDVIKSETGATNLIALNLPVDIAVGKGETIDPSHPDLRHRAALYDSPHENLTWVGQYNGSDKTTAGVSETNLTYDPANGNLLSVIMPKNLHNKRSELDYTYDTLTESYITDIAQTVGTQAFTTSTAPIYDYMKPSWIRDINGNEIWYTYDNFGRLTGIYGPNESINKTNYTVQYIYNTEPGAGKAPYAITKNLDLARGINTIDVITFIDGLGRVIQTKKDAAINGADAKIVSGRIFYDNGGRIKKQYYPSPDTGTYTDFQVSNDPTSPTIFDYDNFDRQATVTYPDINVHDNTTHNQSTFNYYISLGSTSSTSRLKTLVTDPEGNRKATNKDANGNIMKVEEYDKTRLSTPIVTTYVYDELGQIKDVFDAVNNNTHVDYDMLGRRIAINNPDTGLVTLYYDPASNLIQKQTAAIKAAKADDYINYDYDDISRLISVTYPNGSKDTDYMYNVAYEYDGGTSRAGEANVKGRITKVTYGNDYEEKSYDKMGNITQTIDHMTSQNLQQAYTTAFSYDDLSRVLTTTYPDADILTYDYDSGGLVKSARTLTKTYVSSLVYDKFGKRLAINTGDGTNSTYTYYPDSQRLMTLNTTLNGTGIQSLTFAYDNVGNITSLNNHMDKTMDTTDADPAKRDVNRHFTYDGFYRLTQSDGKLINETGNLPSIAANTVTQSYTMSMVYNDIHNISEKHQKICSGDYSDAGVTVNNNYDNVYYYSGTSNFQPHAPVQIGGRYYLYDANGNQLGYGDAVNSPTDVRSIVWDDENRIKNITDHLSPDRISQYWYNDAGQRVRKKEVTKDTLNGAQTETLYINQYQSICSNPDMTQVRTKNIYVGNQRIASVLKTSDPNPFVYYYVTDHLGSTGYLTDSTGKIKEHIEYTPWGESWYENSSVSPLPGYKFTGKEKDVTDLYYYGARYYDPMTSLWQSMDPILNKYLSGQGGSGGIYNSKNFAMMSYAFNNPVILSDPDGNATVVHGTDTVKGNIPWAAMNPYNIGYGKTAEAFGGCPGPISADNTCIAAFDDMTQAVGAASAYLDDMGDRGLDLIAGMKEYTNKEKMSDSDFVNSEYWNLLTHDSNGKEIPGLNVKEKDLAKKVEALKKIMISDVKKELMDNIKRAEGYHNDPEKRRVNGSKDPKDIGKYDYPRSKFDEIQKHTEYWKYNGGDDEEGGNK